MSKIQKFSAISILVVFTFTSGCSAVRLAGEVSSAVGGTLVKGADREEKKQDSDQLQATATPAPAPAPQPSSNETKLEDSKTSKQKKSKKTSKKKSKRVVTTATKSTTTQPNVVPAKPAPAPTATRNPAGQVNEYMIVCSDTSMSFSTSISGLTEQVNAQITNGWVPTGGAVSMSGGIGKICQALVKY